MAAFEGAVILVVALALALAHGPVMVARLPEPDDGAALGKLPYTSLNTRRRVVWLVAIAVVAQVATIAVDHPLRPIWLIYGASVAALIWVDACTTWLPSKLSWLVTAELAIALGICLLLYDDPKTLLLRMTLGALASLTFWWVFWRFSRGALGFGDVRLAPLTGAMAATLGMSGWFVGLLAGTAIGALWGLLFARRYPAPGTERGFAYGPALWAGPYIALIWASFATM